MRLIPSHCGLTLPAMPQVNNAAQTLTRESGWYARMETLEQNAYQSLEPEARSLLATSDALLGLTGPGLDPSPGPGPGSIGMNSMNGQGAVFHTPSLEAGALVSESKPEPQERPEPAVQEGTLEGTKIVVYTKFVYTKMIVYNCFSKYNFNSSLE